MSPAGKSPLLISDEDMGKLFWQLDKIEAEGLERNVIPLAIRLQFEFASRRVEIISLEWEWIDLENRRVVWPGSKTGGMPKPISEEACRLLSTAPRQEAGNFQLTLLRKPVQPQDGCLTFPDPDLGTSQYRNGPACPCLQSETSHEDHRHCSPKDGHAGLTGPFCPSYSECRPVNPKLAGRISAPSL